MKKLDGKIAVITGETADCLATARVSSNEGAYVYITCRRQSELDTAVKPDRQKMSLVFKGDVSNLSESRSFIRHGEAAERPNRYPLRKRRNYWIITV